MTPRIVYYFMLRRGAGAVGLLRIQREIQILLQALDELVWIPGEHEAKTTVCLHVCVCLKKYQGDR